MDDNKTEKDNSHQFNIKILAWIVPFLSILMIIILTILARNYRLVRGKMDTPQKLVVKEINSLENPLLLTALHFESLSPNFIVPPKTLERHFKLLNKVGPYRFLAVIDEKFNPVAATASKKDLDRIIANLKKYKPENPLIIPHKFEGVLDELDFIIPMKPDNNVTYWLYANVSAKEIVKILPGGTTIKVNSNKVKKPLHPHAPHLMLDMQVVSRPIWPLIFGEILLAVGIFILFFGPGIRKRY
ncbi:MAG: hypothetical protein PF689_11875 [Deltaproteobacteria bacterium]|jgi:hypothetical protein|nr:hypothetical protein [Deltaproteobacteria bacterium]